MDRDSSAPKAAGPRQAASQRPATGALLALSVLMTSLCAAAQAPQLGPGFVWSADVLDSDFRSDTLDLSGNVHVQQNSMSIQAQAATARDVRSSNSSWTFRDGVHIRTAAADLRSDDASALIVNGEIISARLQGSPAVFEQRGEQTDNQVRGRAGTIEYDFVNGIVTLTSQVWFSNGKDEFRGELVIYDVRDERVQINPGGSASGRVRGIIRPADKPPAPTDRQPSAQPGQGSMDLERVDREQPGSALRLPAASRDGLLPRLMKARLAGFFPGPFPGLSPGLPSGLPSGHLPGQRTAGMLPGLDRSAPDNRVQGQSSGNCA